MESIYKVNTEHDIPIYQQFVDTICVAIKMVVLREDNRFPLFRK